jgi:hypothetical protein
LAILAQYQAVTDDHNHRTKDRWLVEWAQSWLKSRLRLDCAIIEVSA